jgi:hypothetical protein
MPVTQRHHLLAVLQPQRLDAGATMPVAVIRMHSRPVAVNNLKNVSAIMCCAVHQRQQHRDRWFVLVGQ